MPWWAWILCYLALPLLGILVWMLFIADECDIKEAEEEPGIFGVIIAFWPACLLIAGVYFSWTGVVNLAKWSARTRKNREEFKKDQRCLVLFVKAWWETYGDKETSLYDLSELAAVSWGASPHGSFEARLQKLLEKTSNEMPGFLERSVRTSRSFWRLLKDPNGGAA
jgi:hypothetical protein